MKRFPFALAHGLALACLCVVVSGCTPPGITAPPGSASSPAAITGLDRTLIDDKAVDLAFDALDVAAYGADALIQLKKVTKGSATADAIATGLDTTRYWLNAARRFQRLGQATSYTDAIAQAAAAYKGVTARIAKAKGGT